MKKNRIQEDPQVKKTHDISRREAMTRLGLTAFSVATMLLLLNKPEKALAQSPGPDDADDWDNL